MVKYYLYITKITAFLNIYIFFRLSAYHLSNFIFLKNHVFLFRKYVKQIGVWIHILFIRRPN